MNEILPTMDPTVQITLRGSGLCPFFVVLIRGLVLVSKPEIGSPQQSIYSLFFRNSVFELKFFNSVG